MTARAVGARAGDLHWRWAMGLTVAVSAAAVGLGEIPLGVQLGALLAGVGLVGLPHGALDPLVAGLGLGLGSPVRVAAFLGAYVALAAASLGIWSLSPAAGLGLFLATSAVHFGLGDVPRDPRAGRAGHWLRVLAHGSAPVVLAAASHPGPVAEVFGWLLDCPPTAIAADLGRLALPVWIAWGAVAVAAYLLPGGRRRGTLELAALAAAFLILPPLLSFTVYFCLWHSTRHVLAVRGALGHLAPGVKWAVAAAVLVATAALMATGHWLAGAAASTPDLVRTVFVTLACLTPPHMLVTALMGRAAC